MSFFRDFILTKKLKNFRFFTEQWQRKELAHGIKQHSLAFVIIVASISAYAGLSGNVKFFLRGDNFINTCIIAGCIVAVSLFGKIISIISNEPDETDVWLVASLFGGIPLLTLCYILLN